MGHFNGDCLHLRALSQSGDSADIVKGQITHTLPANSPVTNMMLKSLPKELINGKETKEKLQEIVSTS